jgi:hypothetical protein
MTDAKSQGQSNLEVDCSQLNAPTTSGSSFPVRICYLGPDNRICYLEKRVEVIPGKEASLPVWALLPRIPSSHAAFLLQPNRASW